MKTLFFYLSIFVMFNGKAQSLSISPAKSYIKLCTSYIEKAKTAPKAAAVDQYLDKAEETIESIKKFDKNFDVSKLQSEIETLRNSNVVKTKEESDTKSAASNNNNKEGDGIAGLFLGSTTTEMRNNGNADEDIANHKLQIAAYNQKIDKLIASGVSGANQYANYIRQSSVPALEQIKKLEEQINKADSKKGLIAYRDLVGIETYWNAAKRVFANVTEAADVQQSSAAALQRLGTEEQVASNIKKNYEDKIKNKKMPAAVIVNASLESEFKKIFNNSFKDLTILKINIIAKEWTVIRNEVTGIILGRKHSAAIAAKNKDGNCVLYYFHIGQPYTGSSYGLSAENARGFDGEISCENVK